MQTSIVVLTFFLGAIAVLQGALNRIIAGSWGLAPAIVLNNCVILAAGLVLFGAVKFYPEIFPEGLRDKAGFTSFSWYYVLPGLCGLVLVAGIPFAIGKIGAANVFIGIVCAQMVASLIWDKVVEGIPLTWTRTAGAFFAILGAVMLRIKT